MILAFTGVAVMSCSGTRETAFFTRVSGAICDKIFSSTTEQQRKDLNLGFYYGTSPGECKAVYDEVAGDAFARSTANRNFDDTAAQACAQAVEKLTADEIKKALAASISAQNYGGDQTRAEAARTTLGFPMASCFTMQGSCFAEAACNLATPAGPCAIYKLAPYKDPATRSDELTAASQAANVNFGCGPVTALFF